MELPVEFAGLPALSTEAGSHATPTRYGTVLISSWHWNMRKT